jgi:hypothetical protein
MSNPDYEHFSDDRYSRASIPYTQAKLRSYPGITGEQILAITGPGLFHILHVVRSETSRRVIDGLD